jgi:hypothetical protein
MRTQVPKWFAATLPCLVVSSTAFAAAEPNGKIVYVVNMGFPDYTTDMISGRAITTSEAV